MRVGKVTSSSKSKATAQIRTDRHMIDCRGVCKAWFVALTPAAHSHRYLPNWQ